MGKLWWFFKIKLKTGVKSKILKALSEFPHSETKFCVETRRQYRVLWQFKLWSTRHFWFSKMFQMGKILFQSRHRAVARLPLCLSSGEVSTRTEKLAIACENQHFSSFSFHLNRTCCIPLWELILFFDFWFHNIS